MFKINEILYVIYLKIYILYTIIWFSLLKNIFYLLLNKKSVLKFKWFEKNREKYKMRIGLGGFLGTHLY